MIEFHRLILGDRRRNELFAAALKRLIVPGRTTLADLGSGTGFLGFVASRLGAKRCWLYETSELAELSRELAKANGLSKRCTIVRAHSCEVAEPPRVDVVVSETLGNLALEEGMLQTLQDARRFLAPGGTIVPQKLRQLVAPVVTPPPHALRDVWPRIGFELDFAPARRIAMNNAYVRTFAAADLLDEGRSAQPWDALDFRERTGAVRRAAVEWPLARPVRLYGFAIWWECELLAGVPELLLSTAPDAPRTHWEQVWLPPLAPLEAEAGDTLRLELTCDVRPSVKIDVKWKTTLRDRKGRARATTAQDMKRGYLE